MEGFRSCKREDGGEGSNGAKENGVGMGMEGKGTMESSDEGATTEVLGRSDGYRGKRSVKWLGFEIGEGRCRKGGKIRVEVKRYR